MVYRQSGAGNDHGGREVAMVAPEVSDQVCWSCNLPGHTCSDCTSPWTNYRYRPQAQAQGRGGGGGCGGRCGRGYGNHRGIICNECGIRWHIKANCYCLEENSALLVGHLLLDTSLPMSHFYLISMFGLETQEQAVTVLVSYKV